VQEYRRNQILLNLARNIFEEQNNLECLVTKIMTEAKELLKCERCAVYLLDLDCGEAVSLHEHAEFLPDATRVIIERDKLGDKAAKNMGLFRKLGFIAERHVFLIKLNILSITQDYHKVGR